MSDDEQMLIRLINKYNRMIEDINDFKSALDIFKTMAENLKDDKNAQTKQTASQPVSYRPSLSNCIYHNSCCNSDKLFK
jgi:hypothetical protein